MKGTPQRKQDKSFWLRLGGTLITVVLLAYLLYQQGWSDISHAFGRIAAWRLWAALALTLLSRVAVTMRWHVLLRSANERTSFRQSLRLTFAGLFASNFLPTTVGGDMVRLAGAIQLRMDAAVSTASLVVDRLVGMAGMALALPWGLARVFAVGLPSLRDETTTRRFPSGFLALAAAGWIAPLWNKALDFLKRLWENFKLWTRHPAALAWSMVFTLIHMVCLFTSIWLLLDGMGESVPWMQIAGIWSLVYFITLVPISINGYGLQEVSTTLLYAHLGGISPEASVTVALLIRTLQIAASLPGALFVPGIVAASRQNDTPKA